MTATQLSLMGVKLEMYVSDDRDSAWGVHICRLLNEHGGPQ